MSKPVILLVDDTRLFLTLEMELLKQAGANVITADGGCEAVAMARRYRPDLIYLDFDMPGMSGPECCATLKADPVLRRVPVIMVTTAGSDDDVAAARSAGCDACLSKPLDRATFLEAGRRFLAQIDRREMRIHCRINVVFRMNYENFSGTCNNLGMRGMYIGFDGDVVKGAPVEVSFILSGSNSSLIEAWGKVAWVNSGEHRNKQDLPEGFGVEFLDMTEESRVLIRNFIENCS
ncbi:response regulator [Geobacter sp. DSM 9736]|uniref:response regulator n=1 Tax=Geobacter sp. DSM 9736 TaxID=1277350 RepID=UPI000B4FE4E4|nr:response regulator [Geobacter sp. DSM 9736]SNB45149.1 CheY chemotaxis protein or a CheY-like REC (receiver) domain [Geobacter sp. DSM 9736]